MALNGISDNQFHDRICSENKLLRFIFARIIDFVKLYFKIPPIFDNLPNLTYIISI